MRSEPIHAFKPAVDGNTAQVTLSANTSNSVAVTVPFSGAPENPGSARLLNTTGGVVFARRTTGTQASGPATAASIADIPVPVNVLCYIELDQGTTFLTLITPSSGSVFVTVGMGGGAP